MPSSQNSPWPQRDEELRHEARVGEASWSDIAERMGLTYFQVKGRSNRLGLRKPNKQQLRRVVARVYKEKPQPAPAHDCYPRFNGHLAPGVRTLPILPSIAAMSEYRDCNNVQDNDE